MEMQKATEEKKREIANRIPEELEKKIYDEAKAYGKAGTKKDGTLTWDTFLYIQKTTMKYVYEITHEKLEEYAVTRRALLKEGKHEEYEQNVIDSTSWSLEIRNNMVQVLYAIFEISKETSNRTQ